MKKSKYLLFLILSISQAVADIKCLLIAENDKFIIKDGDLKSRHAPCSTFKIPISLMAYNEKILQNETTPDWEFKNGYADSIDLWK